MGRDIFVLNEGDDIAAQSPGRANDRIKVKKVTSALRTAAGSQKRVDPVSATDLVEARHKKRKAGPIPVSTAAPGTAPVTYSQNASIEAKVNQLFDLFNDLGCAMQPQANAAVPSNAAVFMPSSTGILSDRVEPGTAALGQNLGLPRASLADSSGLWTLATSSAGVGISPPAICQLRYSSLSCNVRMPKVSTHHRKPISLQHIVSFPTSTPTKVSGGRQSLLFIILMSASAFDLTHHQRF
ncbi:LOW QUALITY PROTEIN: hypothetical protein PHMEG_0004283 [Phytophthora megakarya]|uniref:Uncharacterized protein n=1 Tax=Phytophthora megakarya TaxID=4795 RepID=A0A225WWI3_9STRA|nr:LOW QUALITY PROTEIN: hypothetical protein PHMEG_0004283 [Phytophthora megakarya]